MVHEPFTNLGFELTSSLVSGFKCCWAFCLGGAVSSCSCSCPSVTAGAFFNGSIEEADTVKFSTGSATFAMLVPLERNLLIL